VHDELKCLTKNTLKTRRLTHWGRKGLQERLHPRLVIYCLQATARASFLTSLNPFIAFSLAVDSQHFPLRMKQVPINISSSSAKVINLEFFLPAGRALRTRPAGPKITLLFPHLYIYMCVHTYHVRNNYVTYIVAIRPYFSLVDFGNLDGCFA